jgi:hypothetical protein
VASSVRRALQEVSERTERMRAKDTIRVQVDQYNTLSFTSPEGFCDIEGTLPDEAYHIVVLPQKLKEAKCK